jgi:hypothetical protein
MTRARLGSILAALAAVGYLATAWLHSTGYDSVTELAAAGPSDLAALAPALWLVFSLDLVILGLIVAVTAWRPTGPARLVLLVAAFGPLGAAALQLRYLGFIPPTAILLVLGALTLVAAAVTEAHPATPPPRQATP